MTPKFTTIAAARKHSALLKTQINPKTGKPKSGSCRLSLGYNLYLDVAAGGSMSWVFMYKKDGQKEISLGVVEGPLAVTKDQAQADAAALYVQLKRYNIDPKLVRAGIMAAPANTNSPMPMATMQTAPVMVVQSAPVAGGLTMTHWMNETIRQLRIDNGWKDGSDSERRWRNSCEDVAGDLMSLEPGQITTAVADAVIVPQWKAPFEVRGKMTERRKSKNFCDAIKRLAAIWEKAKANSNGAITGDNPFEFKRFERAHGAGYKKSEAVAHKALDAEDMPVFVQTMVADMNKPAGRSKLAPTRAAAALFCAINANRANEAREISDDEVNLDTGEWTLSKERMKAGEEHVVTLPKRALAILRQVKREEGNPHFFAGQVKGQPISEGSLLQAIRDAGFPADKLTGHGLRSTFRDWGGELGLPRELLEFQLAHGVADQVEGAYRRKKGKALRAAIMQAYEDYLFTGKMVDAASIVPALALKDWLAA